MTTLKEADLYEPIKDFFQDQGYNVYGEVSLPYGGGRVDVIARSGAAAIAIELKTKLSVDLIEQAIDRQNYFPYVYIAFYERKQQPLKWLQDFLQQRGIGILEVTTYGTVFVRKKARFQKPRSRYRLEWDSILKPEHQTWLPGGSAGGGYVTEYKLTMKGVRDYLHTAKRIDDAHTRNGPALINTQGWRTIREILDHCETHYMSPKNSLGKALLEFERDWLEVKKENGRLYFRHKE